jgi:NADH:ubiquinone oxidoreductase subunit F (NADH-binding)
VTDDILEKIREANLVGRGGAGFPAHVKWSAVQKAEAKKKYVICNVSERELGVFKDFHILQNHAEKVFEGILIAMEYVGSNECYFNFNADYYEKLKDSIDALTEKYGKEKSVHFHVFKEAPSYIGGEETALMNSIEGKRLQPRLKPPYPTEAGLFGKPTLIHNAETFYNVALVAHDAFENKRFYSISGEVRKEGVYHLPSDLTVLQVLDQTDNLPDFDYFVQAGGGASGVVLNSEQLADRTVGGTGSLIVYRLDANPRDVLLHWLEFYDAESCGKCAPCREGTYQLHKLVKENEEIPWEKMEPILDVLDQTSFCPLGRSLPIPVRSYYQNVLQHMKKV